MAARSKQTAAGKSTRVSPEAKRLDRLWERREKDRLAALTATARRSQADAAALSSILNVDRAEARRAIAAREPALRQWLAAGKPPRRRTFSNDSRERTPPYDLSRKFWRAIGLGGVHDWRGPDPVRGNLGCYAFTAGAGSVFVSTAVGYGIVAPATGLLKVDAGVSLSHRVANLSFLAGFAIIRLELGISIEDTVTGDYSYSSLVIFDRQLFLDSYWHEHWVGERKRLLASCSVLRDRKYEIYVQMIQHASSKGAAMAGVNAGASVESVDTTVV